MNHETCTCGSKLKLVFSTDDGSVMKEVKRCRGYNVGEGKTPYKERKVGAKSRSRSTKLVKIWNNPKLKNEPCVIHVTCKLCGANYIVRGKSKGNVIRNLRKKIYGG